jgi:hypothetical protein
LVLELHHTEDSETPNSRMRGREEGKEKEEV